MNLSTRPQSQNEDLTLLTLNTDLDSNDTGIKSAEDLALEAQNAQRMADLKYENTEAAVAAFNRDQEMIEMRMEWPTETFLAEEKAATQKEFELFQHQVASLLDKISQAEETQEAEEVKEVQHAPVAAKKTAHHDAQNALRSLFRISKNTTTNPEKFAKAQRKALRTATEWVKETYNVSYIEAEKLISEAIKNADLSITLDSLKEEVNKGKVVTALTRVKRYEGNTRNPRHEKYLQKAYRKIGNYLLNEFPIITEEEVKAAAQKALEKTRIGYEPKLENLVQSAQEVLTTPLTPEAVQAQVAAATAKIDLTPPKFMQEAERVLEPSPKETQTLPKVTTTVEFHEEPVGVAPQEATTVEEVPVAEPAVATPKAPKKALTFTRTKSGNRILNVLKDPTETSEKSMYTTSNGVKMLNVLKEPAPSRNPFTRIGQAVRGWFA